MADKEERIFVFTTKKYTIKETNEDGDIVDGFIEPRDKAKMYTRQEAIEVMARAICKEEQHDMTGVCCDEICLVWKKYYLTKAKAVLKALLEGGKK